MPNQPYQKPDFRRTWATPEKFDFQIYTDGAGYTDNFAGCAVTGVSKRFSKFFQRATAFWGIETDRAEFEGVLLGLHTILNVMGIENVPQHRMLQAEPMTVLVISDREDLVGSMSGENFNSKPPYERRANKDLWARFAWYEQYFQIIAAHRERNTNPLQGASDRLASEVRVMMKNYVEILHADGVIKSIN